MPRKKLSAPNVALFAGPSPATGTHTTANIKELYGIQSFSYDLSTSNEDLFVFGVKAAVGRESLDPALATFDFSYYLSNFDNEKSFGFNTSGTSGTFAPLLAGTSDERNFFVMIAGDGQDAIGSSPASTPCLGFGNATISSYGFNAAVGSYPTVSISCEAVDAAYYTDSDTEPLPAIDFTTNAVAAGTFTLPTPSGNFGQRDPVLRPGDITVNLSGVSGLFHDFANACVQSVDFSVDFGRTPQLCLGSKYRRESLIADNVPMTFSVEILAKDMVTGRLSNFTCGTGNYRAIVNIKRPNCNGGGATAATFDLKGLTWESQSQSVDLGSDSTVTVNFQGTIGGANDLTRGLFTSGITRN